MPLKIIGSAILLGLCFVISHQTTSIEHARVAQTESLLALLRYIRTQVSCFCTPMCEMFRDYEDATLEACGLLAPLRESGDLLLALSRCEDRLYLDEEELRSLFAFAREIGSGYREETDDCCAYYIRELEGASERRRVERPARVRTARSLILCAGLMLVIILV